MPRMLLSTSKGHVIDSLAPLLAQNTQCPPRPTQPCPAARRTLLTSQVESDLSSLLADKRGLSYRVRVETTGRPPEHPTQTVVQRIVMVAEEEVIKGLSQ